MATGLTVVSAVNLCDASKSQITNATIFFQPVLSSGKKTSFQFGGDTHGVGMAVPVSTQVVNGAFSVALADTTLTVPVNIGYAVTVLDNETGDSLLGPGYGCVQPSGATFSLDTYIPDLAGSVSVVVGPRGAQGPAGPVSGSVLVNASGAAFTLSVWNGNLALLPQAPVLIDQGTGALWAVGVAADSGGVNRVTFTQVSSAPYPLPNLLFYDPVALRVRTLTMLNGTYAIT